MKIFQSEEMKKAIENLVFAIHEDAKNDEEKELALKLMNEADKYPQPPSNK